MMKIRVTYDNEQPQQVQQLIENLEKDYRIMNQSDPYKGRGKSVYSSVYIDVEPK